MTRLAALRMLTRYDPTSQALGWPINFELVISLKTPKALDLDVSSQLQQRADEANQCPLLAQNGHP